MDKLWLPTGHHWGLSITRDRLDDAGPFTGGGHKLCWHTTEGSSMSGALSTLRQNRDAPHFIADARAGRIIQCIPLNRAGRALAHPSGPETNRANVIQVEIVGRAAESGDWPIGMYRNLAALTALIDHRFSVKLHALASFAHPQRLTGAQFFKGTGHCGHVHVPGNDHTDPGANFRWAELVNQVHAVHDRYGE